MSQPEQESLFNIKDNSIRSDSLFERMSAALQNSTNPYAKKDVLKATNATKFIGRGSVASSTNKYRLAAGSLANCGKYSKEDIVFVSAEGARKNRIDIDIHELTLATNAGASFITDNFSDRNRPYNVGEREVEAFLISSGYRDDGAGYWTKSA